MGKKIAKVINNSDVNPYSLKFIKLRELLKLSQRVFGENIGSNRDSISQIEIHRNGPTVELIAKAAIFYSVPYEFFFDENYELTVKDGKVIGGYYRPVEPNLLHENEMLRDRLEICQEKLKNKEERIEMLEEKLEALGVRKRDVV